MGTITLYEGNGASQNIVHSYDDVPYKGQVKPNDEARSAKLQHVKAGRKITVYDSKSENTGDDYTTIEVKREVAEIIIEHFEKNVDNENVRVTHVHNNGLNGKVSYIVIA